MLLAMIKVSASEAQWKMFTDGLPSCSDSEITGLSNAADKAYLSFNCYDDGFDKSKNGLYILNEEIGSWQQLASKPTHYRFSGDIAVTQQGDIYTYRENLLFKLVAATDSNSNTPYTWTRTKLPFRAGGLGECYAGTCSDKLFLRELKKYNNFYTYDLKSGAIESLVLPYQVDRKPHVSLLEDAEGNMWYKSNYSGVFKYNFTKQEWTKESDRSGALSVGGDGQVYLSYEKAKTTQISTLFKYLGDAKWQQIQQSRGYGHKGLPFGKDQSTMLFYASRFDDYVLDGTRKVNIPDRMDLSAAGVGILEANTIVKVKEGLMATFRFRDRSKTRGSQYFLGKLAFDVNAAEFYNSNIDLTTGTYIGSNFTNDEAIGVEVMADGKILAALNTGGDYDIAATTVYKGTSSSFGTVAVLNADGTNVLSVLKVDSKLHDIAVSGSKLAIAGASGITVLDLTNNNVLWSYDYASAKKRIAISSTGNVIAMLDNKKIMAFSATGSQLFTKDIARSYTEDVAVTEVNGEPIFYEVGFQNDKTPRNYPIQVCHVYAFDKTGKRVWKLFDFPGSSVENRIADTRLYRAEIGEDGQLYISGESAGSSTIFMDDGTQPTGKDILTKIDFHNDLWNTKSAHMTYLARVNPVKGDILKSQLTMTRLSNGKSNTFKTRGLAASTEGRVFMSGIAAAHLQNRDFVSVNGELAKAYEKGDTSIIGLAPEFTTRNFWSTLVKDSAPTAGNKMAMDVAVKGNKLVVLSEVASEAKLYTTANAMDKLNTSGKDNVHLSVIDVSQFIPKAKLVD
jgi:hypothetical protein